MIRAAARAAIVDERGVTVPEVLAAVAVIGIGLVGLAVVIPLATYGVQEGGQLSTATFLAEQMIERARGTTWSADPPMDCLGVSAADSAPLPGEATCHGTATTQFPDETAGVSGHPGYQRFVRVSGCGVPPGCADVTDAALRLVTVTVRYRPLAPDGGQSPSLRAARLDWLVSKK